MDIMIPYLGPITRLALESKSAFHIAGVQQSARAKKVELEERKKREIEKQHKLSFDENKSRNKTADEDDGKPHLDTWA
ncbi:hypothetical protein [Pseudoalteromonas sp.]|uniref:hypothetical protein n=1 Tax=Pseudoalteromonas sp. TaxID=53249 RepID=UPI001BCFDFC5|nr:hypothetical protein [Pseudoalteromonas sp.]